MKWATVDGQNPAPLGMPQKVKKLVLKTSIWGILSDAGLFPSTVLLGGILPEEMNFDNVFSNKHENMVSEWGAQPTKNKHMAY